MACGLNVERIIKQDGRNYRQDWLGNWVAEKDWLGQDKVETDWLGNPKIERDWLGRQKVETDWLGRPIVPPKYISEQARSQALKNGGAGEPAVERGPDYFLPLCVPLMATLPRSLATSGRITA